MDNSEYVKAVRLRPYTMKELINLYEISWHVLSRWLKNISKDLGDRVAGYYNIKQVQLIFETFGIPGQEMIFY